MFNVLAEMFSYSFLVRAVIVGLLVSLCASMLGVSLVLKRYSMIGDGLSHVGFGALAVATAMNAAPLSVSIPVVVAAAFLLLRISENSKIKGDAAIALISTASLAVGVVVISLTTGMTTDVCNYLFGSILAMTKGDVYLSISLSVGVLILFGFFYHKIFAVTFDETFARATGTRAGSYNMILALLTALTIVLGMRMMGAMLISSLIIFPALTSMRVCKRFKTVIICAAVVSVICFFIGVVASYLYSLPTGASVVLVNLAALILFSLYSFIRKGGLKKLFGKKLAAGAAAVMLLFVGCGEASTTSQTVVANFGTTGGASSSSASSEVETQANGESSTTHADPEIDMDADVIEINERLFIAQTNDMYLNFEDYVGKTIRYEGIYMYDMYMVEDEVVYYHYVIRYGPGCCGYDGTAGFEILYDGEMPFLNDWVEVTGTFCYGELDGWLTVYLEATDIQVKEERGQEYVST